MAFKFEDLKVWQLSVDLASEVADLVKGFPVEERFVLSQQIQRASDSVALNIAEGSTGQTNKEFKKFLGYAVRSAIEVVCCFHLAVRRKLITQNIFNVFYEKLTVLIKGIQAIRNSIP